MSRIVCEDRSVISSTIAAACATTLAPNKRDDGPAGERTASNKRNTSWSVDGLTAG
jgi:hypothetical protein